MTISIFKKILFYVPVLCVFLFTCPGSFLLAQELTWVTAEGTALMDNGGEEDVKEIALKAAEQNALEKVVGENISAEAIIVNLRLSGGILGAIPYFRVVKKEILEEDVLEVVKNGEATASLTYKVKIKAGILEESEDAGPGISFNASLNKTSFKNGDEIQVRITPAKDSYVSIFNILEDEKILRLLPNRFKQDNLLKANETFHFPSTSDKARGLSLIAHTPEGKKSTTEIFLILALNQPLEIDNGKFQEAIFGEYDGKTAFMNDLIKQIVSIPYSDRGERLIQYEIREK